MRAVLKSSTLTSELSETSVSKAESERPPAKGFRALVKVLRPHQWAKNALLLLPMVLAPDIPSGRVIFQGLLAFATFSLSASAGYILNDILDIEADRAHPTKRRRPFASGALPVAAGIPYLLLLVAASFGMAFAFLPLSFVAMLGLYLVGTLSYSFYLKKQLLVDVLVLAGLYAHRILSGGIATGVQVSSWLLGFSMFFFTSLAFAKRYVELKGARGSAKILNRAYFPSDVEMVTSMGTSSGYIAALVFMLYVESAAVRVNYRVPSLLWLILPILLYWLGRVWLLAGRGQLQDDPVKFAVKDLQSVLCAVGIVLIAGLARFAPVWLTSSLR
jgi:4-hydroxybenzoate polyprenyltransferase